MGWPRPLRGGFRGDLSTATSPFESTGSLWSSFAEIHATELGALLGLIVVLTYWNRPRVAYALLFFGVFLAFGTPEVAGGPIHRKPWYFLAGVYVPTIIGLANVERAQRTTTRRTDGEQSTTGDGLPDPADTEFEFPAAEDDEFQFPDERGDR